MTLFILAHFTVFTHSGADTFPFGKCKIIIVDKENKALPDFAFLPCGDDKMQFYHEYGKLILFIFLKMKHHRRDACA